MLKWVKMVLERIKTLFKKDKSPEAASSGDESASAPSVASPAGPAAEAPAAKAGKASGKAAKAAAAKASGKAAGKLDVSARFELTREAVSGTMSKFREAREVQTGKRLGLKLLDSDKTNYFENRFKGLNKPSEGEIAIAIKHPNVVETYEHGFTTTGQRYIIMEFVDGPGLNTLTNNRSADLEGKRLPLIRQMALAVQAVHDAGFIHRDICPRNFICSLDLTTLKLIDFGLTVPAQREYMLPGNRTGTPLYMAPEIVRRRATDKRVDIFALGVTIYRLCTFEYPWPGADATGKGALTHDTEEPVNIAKFRPQINPTLAKAIHACIAPLPQNRPESADQFLKMIRNVEFEDVVAGEKK